MSNPNGSNDWTWLNGSSITSSKINAGSITVGTFTTKTVGVSSNLLMFSHDSNGNLKLTVNGETFPVKPGEKFRFTLEVLPIGDIELTMETATEEEMENIKNRLLKMLE